MKNISIGLCILGVVAGCEEIDQCEEEKLTLVDEIAYGQTIIDIEFTSDLLQLIDSGELEKLEKILAIGQFLNLKTLGDISHNGRNRTFFESYRPRSAETLKAQTAVYLEKYYTDRIETAGQQYVNIPSNMRPIREGRQFLEQMKEAGLPRQTNSP